MLTIKIPPRVEYRLTSLGLTLFAVLNDLQLWGENYIATRAEKSNNKQKTCS